MNFRSFKNICFQGETDIEQLAIVLQTLGTPTEETWPGMKHLPDFNKITFPHFNGVPWKILFPDANDKLIEFIKSFLLYNHKKRITAKEVRGEE